LPSRALVHWSFDGWKTTQDSDTRDTGLGIHSVDLPTEKLRGGEDVTFTLYWPESNRWDGTDFVVRIE
jgi:glucoamylase